MLGLKVKAFDPLRGSLKLEASETKNRRPRQVALCGVTLELVRQACLGKKPEDHIISRSKGKRILDLYKAWAAICVEAGQGRYECAHCGGPVTKDVTELKRQGRGRPPRQWFYRCAGECDRRIGFDGVRYAEDSLHVHDLRRSCAIRMIRAGISLIVIKDTMGWSSLKMLERYACENTEAVKAGQELLAKYDAAVEAERIARAQAALSAQESTQYDARAQRLPGVLVPVALN